MTPPLHIVHPVEHRELADDDLMLLVQEGHRDAMHALIVRHQEMVIGCASRYFGDRQLGHEVAQDVFLSLWHERQRYRGRGRLKSYLLTLVFHRCHAVARARRYDRAKLSRLAEQPVADPPGTPLEVALGAARRSRVQRELANLPEAIRTCLILRYLAGFSLQEVAAQTKKPLGTVKANIFRGLLRLRGMLHMERQ